MIATKQYLLDATDRMNRLMEATRSDDIRAACDKAWEDFLEDMEEHCPSMLTQLRASEHVYKSGFGTGACLVNDRTWSQAREVYGRHLRIGLRGQMIGFFSVLALSAICGFAWGFWLYGQLT